MVIQLCPFEVFHLQKLQHQSGGEVGVSVSCTLRTEQKGRCNECGVFFCEGGRSFALIRSNERKGISMNKQWETRKKGLLIQPTTKQKILNSSSAAELRSGQTAGRNNAAAIFNSMHLLPLFKHCSTGKKTVLFLTEKASFLEFSQSDCVNDALKVSPDALKLHWNCTILPQAAAISKPWGEHVSCVKFKGHTTLAPSPPLPSLALPMLRKEQGLMAHWEYCFLSLSLYSTFLMLLLEMHWEAAHSATKKTYSNAGWCPWCLSVCRPEIMAFPPLLVFRTGTLPPSELCASALSKQWKWHWQQKRETHRSYLDMFSSREDERASFLNQNVFCSWKHSRDDRGHRTNGLMLSCYR